MQNNIQQNLTQHDGVTGRRYDLDWLRVIAFAVLILYHIGMYYVHDWGWHIKSEVTSTFLQDVMILTNPWRMSLLFFISGMALALVNSKYSRTRLAQLRTSRLLVPLLFGMFVIVAPQVYVEALDQHLIAPGFVNFWLEYINPNTELLKDHQSSIGLLTWNHLWFLPYLWAYSLIILLASKSLSLLAQTKALAKMPLWMMTVLSMTSLLMIWLALRTKFPSSHDLINDWYNHGKYFLFFCSGFVFAIQKQWWTSVIKHRNTLLLIALSCYAFIIADRHGAFPEMAGAFQTNLLIKITYGIVFTANIWCWIFAAIGFTGYFLTKPNKWLTYANKAILPWYILHQTLIVVIAWWLKPFAISPMVEFPLLLSLTVLGCVVGYEIIRRVSLLRWLSGVSGLSSSNKKLVNKTNQQTHQATATTVNSRINSKAIY